jgi:SAM-dependent methyltransferase
VGIARRSVFAAAWGIAWALDAAGRAVTYLAAGALTRDELRAAIARNWESFGLDEPFILSGLSHYEQEFYDRFLRPGDTILLIGCGTGRDLIALLRRGHEVEGLDPARRPLLIARQMLDTLGLTAVLRAEGIETAELERTYDVVVFSQFCYGYLPETRSRVAVLEKVKAALRPGGRVIIPYTPVARRRTLPIRLTRLVTSLSRSDWRPEVGDKLWVSLADWRFVHFDHEFEPGEVEAEAVAAGLRVAFHSQGPTAPEGFCVLTTTPRGADPGSTGDHSGDSGWCRP